MAADSEEPFGEYMRISYQNLFIKKHAVSFYELDQNINDRFVLNCHSSLVGELF